MYSDIIFKKGADKMEYNKFNNTIVARIDKGEEILDKIKEIALREDIKLANINALGAVNDFTVGVFSCFQQFSVKHIPAKSTQ